jgi:hypothetical protein
MKGTFFLVPWTCQESNKGSRDPVPGNERHNPTCAMPVILAAQLPALLSVLTVPTLTCPQFGNLVSAPWRQLIFALWCPGTGWRDLHSCRDLNCWGQNDLGAAFIKCVCCLSEVLGLVWSIVCLWHGLFRVAPRFQNREGGVPGTQLQLCGLLWHSSQSHVALFYHTLVGRTNSGPLSFKGEEETSHSEP